MNGDTKMKQDFGLPFYYLLPQLQKRVIKGYGKEKLFGISIRKPELTSYPKF